MAYWNLPVRCLTHAGSGRLFVNGQPLIFFHFSGFEPDKPEALSRHAPWLDIRDQPLLKEMVANYRTRLEAGKRSEYEAWGYGFETLSDGTTIKSPWREAIRTCHPLLATIDDPFDVSRHYQLASLLDEATLPAHGTVQAGSTDGVIKNVLRSLTPPAVWWVLRWVKNRLLAYYRSSTD
jgi:hypothetical protein